MFDTIDSMKTVEFRNQCFADFLEGKSLRQIALDRSISPRTLERWSSADHWVIRRERHRNDLYEEIIREKHNHRLNQDKSASGLAFDLFKLAHAQRLAYFQGKIPKKAVKVSMRQFVQLAKAFYHANFAERLNAFDVAAKIENYDETI